jgi:cytochrome c peroxidase
MNNKHWLVVILLATGFAFSNSVVDVFNGFLQPANFPAAVYHFNTNAITQAKFELGRKLFYEPRLSRDNTITCGTCHIQAAGFTHHGHDVSHGIEDRLGKRNSQPLANLAWSKTFLWDGGVFDLDLQPIVPITNPVEMDERMNRIISKLSSHTAYPGLFKQAFGTEEISAERVLKALSQFMVMLVSANAKYDSVTRGEGAAFTPREQQGYQLFKAHCNSCHKEPLFTDGSFRDNGIGPGANKDEGRLLITLQEQDRYVFKVPALRNISYTAPYMHDGRFITLEAVLEHYAGHVQRTPNLDPLLKQQGSLGIALTKEEQASIIQFLKTLDDSTFITDKRFGEQ